MKKEEIKQYAVNYAVEKMGQDVVIDPIKNIHVSDMLADFYAKTEAYKEKRSNMTEPVQVDIGHSIYSIPMQEDIYQCPTCTGYVLQWQQKVCECGQTLEWSDDATRG